MDFLRVSRHKNIFSESLYVLLNLALVAVLFLLINVSGQIELALLLVLVSKWRVLAVRMRYWRANILANLVDITVGFGVIGLMYLATTAQLSMVFWLQLAVAIFYGIWLIVIKPLSSKRAMLLQALIGLFVGSWAVMALSHMIPLPIVVLLLAMIGYGSARHALAVHEEEQLALLSLVAGLLVAEIGWIMYHWNIGYGSAAYGDLKIPQAAIVLALGGFTIERVYAGIVSKKPLLSVECVVPVIFSTLFILVLLLIFSSAGTGIV